MTRKPTMHDVAARAGVSVATVSFAFTKPERVRDQTLRAVLAAAEELGYVPSASARGLRRGRTGAIGLYAFDYLLDPTEPAVAVAARPPDGRLFPLYVDEVQHGAELECRRLGYALMLGGNRTPPNRPPVVEVAGRVDALIAFAGAAPEDALRQIASAIPVVELGGEERVEGVRTVLVDNYGGMRDLTRHLLDVHAARTFAYVGEVGTAEFRARYAAFCDVLRDSGRTPPRHTSVQAGDDASAARAVAQVLAAGPVPDVLVCDTDQSALAAIDALRARGLDVPRDVAVTGFDGIVAGRLREPALTTVRQPMEAVGRAAVQIVASRLDEGFEPDGAPDLGCHLLVGRSCGCA